MSTEPQGYVLGFAFDLTQTLVVLTRKNKPAWQAGLLNGVGGKIEPGESGRQAMVREFQEETGAETNETDWDHFCTLNGEEFRVYCYKMESPDVCATVDTRESEQVEVRSVSGLLREEGVSNLRWLLEAARDENGGRPFAVTVDYAISKKSSCGLVGSKGGVA